MNFGKVYVFRNLTTVYMNIAFQSKTTRLYSALGFFSFFFCFAIHYEREKLIYGSVSSVSSSIHFFARSILIHMFHICYIKSN